MCVYMHVEQHCEAAMLLSCTAGNTTYRPQENHKNRSTLTMTSHTSFSICYLNIFSYTSFLGGCYTELIANGRCVKTSPCMHQPYVTSAVRYMQWREK